MPSKQLIHIPIRLAVILQLILCAWQVSALELMSTLSENETYSRHLAQGDNISEVITRVTSEVDSMVSSEDTTISTSHSPAQQERDELFCVFIVTHDFAEVMRNERRLAAFNCMVNPD